jgi:hypothetical protein
VALYFKGAASVAQSENNHKQIGLAMHNFHSDHKHFPTGIRDKKGKLLLSWRVQILPYLAEQQLHAKFKLDEPWNSPHNVKLVKQMPDVFRYPTSKAEPGKTIYLVPSGKGLLFDSAAPERKFRDITDGSSNTIFVLEASDNAAVTWTAPEDLNVDPKQPLKGVRSNEAGRFLILLGDGMVRAFDHKMPPMDFYAFLSIAGGEVPRFP